VRRQERRRRPDCAHASKTAKSGGLVNESLNLIASRADEVCGSPHLEAEREGKKNAKQALRRK